MRRLWLAAAVLSAACASPAPCTQALCPTGAEGTYRVNGWNAAVTVAPGSPEIPIVSDATVDVLSGTVRFVNGLAVVAADAGASFRFEVSSGPVAVPSILVSSGSVSVALSSGAVPTPLPPGTPYFLPVAKK